LRLMPVPQVYPTTYSEDARYLAGYRQQYLHKQRKAGRRMHVSSQFLAISLLWSVIGT
jgi:hypothetical protein